MFFSSSYFTYLLIIKFSKTSLSVGIYNTIFVQLILNQHLVKKYIFVDDFVMFYVYVIICSHSFEKKERKSKYESNQLFSFFG